MEISVNYQLKSKGAVKILFARHTMNWCESSSLFNIGIFADTAPTARLRVWFAALIVTLAVSGCQPAGLVHDGAIDQHAMDRIVQDVQKAATLQYLRPVKAKMVTLSMARKFFDDSAIDESGGKESFRALSQIQVGLGLVVLPENCQCDPKDYLEFATRSNVSALATVYEISPDSVAVVDGGDERSGQVIRQLFSVRQKTLNFLADPRTFLTQRSYVEISGIHAFAGALIDQHFGIDDDVRHLRGNSDERAALSAVKNGEKSLIYNATSGTSAAAVCSNLGKVGWWGGFLSRFYGPASTLVSKAGTDREINERFVCEAYERGGWAAVNGLYRTPPRSMQQVLHPTLYYDHPLLPIKITLAGYEGQLTDWTKMYEDTYGEAWLWQMLGGITPYNVSEAQVAAKWAGDRMVVLKKGDRVSAIWLIVFRDKLSAATFFKNYRLPDYRSTRAEVRVTELNDAVLITVGDIAKDLDQLAPAIWNQTRIKSADGKERRPWN